MPSTKVEDKAELFWEDLSNNMNFDTDKVWTDSFEDNDTRCIAKAQRMRVKLKVK